VLYGHSEGAGIALLYAAMRHPVRAIIAECPIVAPEKTTADTIRQLEAGYASSDMGRRLARYHANADEVFYSWIQSNRAAFSKEFPFEEYLKAVTCPLLVLQGDHDEFGSVLQFEIIRRYVPQAQHAVFEAGHLLHREVPELVVSHATSFLQALPRSSSALQPYTKHQFLQE
jgi:pimeloyl-ACP methyl ester carboxylesterase